MQRGEPIVPDVNRINSGCLNGYRVHSPTRVEKFEARQMGIRNPDGIEQSCSTTIALSDGKRSARIRSRSASNPGLSIELTINTLGSSCPNRVSRPETPISGEALEKIAPTIVEPRPATTEPASFRSTLTTRSPDSTPRVFNPPANLSTRLRSSPRFNRSVRPLLLNDVIAGSCKSVAVSQARRFSA